jgi:ribosomal protein S18 acetylase RimI-like enzyme
LIVLRGPKERYKQGSHWVVCDKHGYAELLLMPDSKSFHLNTLYIEHLAVKEPLRGRGYGKNLYLKVETFAHNIGVDYIQLDSEQEAVGFWSKMGFKALDTIYYQNKTALIKEI